MRLPTRAEIARAIQAATRPFRGIWRPIRALGRPARGLLLIVVTAVVTLAVNTWGDDAADLVADAFKDDDPALTREEKSVNTYVRETRHSNIWDSPPVVFPEAVGSSGGR